jgi:tryptophan halogenase
MKTGRVDNFWKGNCIAIGLSGGFIEPLESTGIYMVEAGLSELEQYFPDREINPRFRDLYNQHMRFIYDQTKDFIVYHYCMTEREDTPFWRDNKHSLVKSDDLEFLLELWQTKVPSITDFTPRVFSQDHYSFLMVGHRAWPKRRTPRQDLIQPDDMDGLVKFMEDGRKKILPRAVDHLGWLRSLRPNDVSKPDAAVKGA